MAKRPKITETELVAILRSEETDAVGYYTSDIASEQEEALDRYRGKPYGDEVEGRSSVVSRDVAEIVDWMMPDMMRVFLSNERAISFAPSRQGDEEYAQQATDYCRYLFWKANPGFTVAHNVIKDGLLQKIGVGKVWWDDTETKERHSYTGLSTEDLAKFEQDSEAEIVEFDVEEIDPADPEAMAGYPDGMMYSATVLRTMSKGQLAVEAVPPEEFLVSRRSKNLDDAYYKAHRRLMTRQDLINMDFDKEQVMDLPAGDSVDMDTRRVSRFDDEDHDIASAADDPMFEELLVLEEYIRVDLDGDGYSELRKIIRVDGEILENEEVADHPFWCWSPKMIPHKLIGESLADDVEDLQRIKTVLWRNMLDNIYQMNNQRTAVDIGMDANNPKVNLDDLLTSRPGGVVRTKGNPADSIMPLIHPPLPDTAGNMMDYVDQVRELRTGVGRNTTALDPDVLAKATASGINRVFDNLTGRKEMITRIFAETGYRQLWRKMLRLIVENQDRPTVIRLRDKWVPIDPRSWNVSMDIEVEVGIGAGNKDQMLIHLKDISDKQMWAMQTYGPLNPIAGPEQFYNTMDATIQNAGLKDAERFFLSPEMQKQQAEQQAKAAEENPPPADPNEMLMQVELNKHGLEEFKARLDDDRERDKAELDARVKIAVAQIGAGATLTAQEIKAMSELDRAEIAERGKEKREGNGAAAS